MTKNQLLDSIMAGKFKIVAEYRLGRAERITWRDGDSGKQLTAPAVRHTLEAGDMVLILNERVPENYDIVAFKAPHPKGTKVVIDVTGFTMVRGVPNLQGTLQPLDG